MKCQCADFLISSIFGLPPGDFEGQSISLSQGIKLRNSNEIK